MWYEIHRDIVSWILVLSCSVSHYAGNGEIQILFVKNFYCQSRLEKLLEKKHECPDNKEKKLVWPESSVALIVYVSAGWSNGDVNIVPNGKTALFEGFHIIWPAFSGNCWAYFTSGIA